MHRKKRRIPGYRSSGKIHVSHLSIGEVLSCAPWRWENILTPTFTLFRPLCPAFSFADVDTYGEGLCRNVCDGNSGATEREKTEEKLFGQGESRYQGERTVGEGSVNDRLGGGRHRTSIRHKRGINMKKNAFHMLK